ncbi:hypothetical protein [Paraburkholderia sp. J7]|uniref:hypothetical protein n=1 Tax=Paraburkholderia sp. J7 TaxID=2805438 RepID=UPI002AB7AA26|nr:hypothetical protein [Paraburkholderia sp. J7]
MSEFATAHRPPLGARRIRSIAYQMFIEAFVLFIGASKTRSGISGAMGRGANPKASMVSGIPSRPLPHAFIGVRAVFRAI